MMHGRTVWPAAVRPRFERYDGGHPHFPARGRRNPPGRGKSPGCHSRDGMSPSPSIPFMEICRLRSRNGLSCPDRQRKIVLATNIAETSLTIEGVRVVIDGGQVRRLQYDPATGMNRLVTVTTSRASAIQRQGRAGRLGPGTCYRLYSRHDYDSMIPYAPPEILTSDLSSLVLDLATWGVTNPSALAWLDPPPQGAWEVARRLLMDLDALKRNGTATPMGRAMARLPLHPRLGRMLLGAADSGHLRLGADLAALLSERDIIRGDIPRRGVSPFHCHEGADISERLSMLQLWRKEREAPPGTDASALQSVERAAEQLRNLTAAMAVEAVR